jgi:hypothetical protein
MSTINNNDLINDTISESKTQTPTSTNSTSNISFDKLLPISQLDSLKYLTYPDELFTEIADVFPYTDLINSSNPSDARTTSVDFHVLGSANVNAPWSYTGLMNDVPLLQATEIFPSAVCKRDDVEKKWVQNLIINDGKYVGSGTTFQRQIGKLSGFKFTDLWYLGKLDADYRTIDGFPFAMLFETGQNTLAGTSLLTLVTWAELMESYTSFGTITKRPILYDHNLKVGLGLTWEQLIRLYVRELDIPNVIFVDVSGGLIGNTVVPTLVDASPLSTDGIVRYLRAMTSKQDWAWGMFLGSAMLYGDGDVYYTNLFLQRAQMPRQNFLDQVISYFSNEKVYVDRIKGITQITGLQFGALYSFSSMVKTCLFCYNMQSRCSIPIWHGTGYFDNILSADSLRNLCESVSINLKHPNILVGPAFSQKVCMYVPYEYFDQFCTNEGKMTKWVDEVSNYTSELNGFNFPHKFMKPKAVVSDSNSVITFQDAFGVDIKTSTYAAFNAVYQAPFPTLYLDIVSKKMTPTIMSNVRTKPEFKKFRPVVTTTKLYKPRELQLMSDLRTFF